MIALQPDASELWDPFSKGVMDQPLSGASIYNAGDLDTTIVAMGGRVATRLEDATHALWVSQGMELSNEARGLLEKCQELQVPVVDASWLERMSGLSRDEHWSEIDVGSHVPAVLADLKPRRRDDTASLEASIGETWAHLIGEAPGFVEEKAVRRAMELSMLDCALVLVRQKKVAESAHRVLGVSESATLAEIKAAYRKKALETHPDKGGSEAAFERVARAYRTLALSEIDDDVLAIKSTAQRDEELRDHRGLVDELFASHGGDVRAHSKRQDAALRALGLTCVEAGASNKDEHGRPIANSCFYLSLATSYLSGVGALDDDSRSPDPHDPTPDDELRADTALRLKRLIEAAVLAAHPEWAAQGKVGEDVQAFSDFLVFILDSPTLVSDLCVAVFDSVSGFVDIYKGTNYDKADGHEQRANLLTLLYVPGHYQPLLPLRKTRPTLTDLLFHLDNANVLYVVTDG